MTTHITQNGSAIAPALDFNIALEETKHLDDIHQLHESVFGPGRFARAAFRVREQGDYDHGLSFVATNNTGELLGTVRLTWIATTQSKSVGLLLGPLAVTVPAQGLGIGKALVALCVEAAKATKADYLMLVGDQPYYGKLGFIVAPKRRVTMPAPVDLNRLLVCPLRGFDASVLAGEVRHMDLVSL